MPSFEEHCRDCERLLGDRCEAVNRWIDAMFKRFGQDHRFVRHHWRGIDQAAALFGQLGRKAAIVHILKDCGFVPKDRDWKEGRVDRYGMDQSKVFNGYWDPATFERTARQLLDEDERLHPPHIDTNPLALQTNEEKVQKETHEQPGDRSRRFD